MKKCILKENIIEEWKSCRKTLQTCQEYSQQQRKPKDKLHNYSFPICLNSFYIEGGKDVQGLFVLDGLIRTLSISGKGKL